MPPHLPLVFAATLFSAATHAQWQPARPVQIIVPNPPGGGPDFIARLLAPRLSEAAKQNVVVDNRSSNNGIVGAEAAARGAPDGSSMIIGNSGTHAINASLYAKIPYDPVKDFAPITMLATLPNMLIVHPSLNVSSVAELVALLKANPGRYSFGSAGNGTSQHISGEMFKIATGTQMQQIGRAHV